MSDDQLAIVKIESSEENGEEEEEEDGAEISEDVDNDDHEEGDAKRADERDPNAEYMILHKVCIVNSPYKT